MNLVPLFLVTQPYDTSLQIYFLHVFVHSEVHRQPRQGEPGSTRVPNQTLMKYVPLEPG
jgi:hypothetical protein